jgi:phosphoribosylaminoimidazole-succinocarboxamide synthase
MSSVDGEFSLSLSLWWFEQLADVIPNHAIWATDVPAGHPRTLLG